ncbi:MAG TPA: hypothetical protein IGQ44_03975 [Geminocystis sp. M7585_C2015_104]|nr:hypothetical protein [Geminocystis sp. M7585_C2015_104]
MFSSDDNRILLDKLRLCLSQVGENNPTYWLATIRRNEYHTRGKNSVSCINPPPDDNRRILLA